MHNLKFLKYDVNYPAAWNELNEEQLLFVGSLFMREISEETFYTLVIQKFTGIKWDDFFKMPVEVIAEISKTLDFLLKSPELTENKLKIIKTGKKKLYGPEDALLNVTFEQYFGHAEPAFNSYMSDKKNSEMLNYLTAALYAFDDKGNFNADRIDEIMPLISKLDYKYKNAVLIFYLGCRDLLASKFPKLFSKKKTTSGSTDIAYFEMIENLNNENISNNEAVKKSNIYEAFLRLTKIIEKSEELKKRRK